MEKKILPLILLAITCCASTTNPSKVQQLADKALEDIFGARGQAEHSINQGNLDGQVYELQLQRKTRLNAQDTIVHFARDLAKGIPSEAQVCDGAKTIDLAVKRHIDKRIGKNASGLTKRNEYEQLVEEFPAVEVVYSTIGFCQTAIPWIEKPAATKKN